MHVVTAPARTADNSSSSHIFAAQQLALLRAVFFPAAGAPAETGTVRRVYAENIASRDTGDASAIGHVAVTEAVATLVSGLGSRQYLISGGHCVLNRRYVAETTSYAGYLEAQGLAPKDSINNVVWVDDPTQTLAVLQYLAELGCEAVPYVQRSAFFDLARQAGTSVLGSGYEVAINAVEHFYDKTHYRDWMVKHHGKAAIPFERCTFSPDSTPDVSTLQRIMAYSDACCVETERNPEGRAVFFVQVGKAGGGVGNARAMCLNDGSFTLTNSFGEPEHFGSLGALAEKLKEMGSKERIDVSPYVRVTRSYTLGLMISDDGVTVIGPLDQVLSPGSNDYQGWAINRDATDNEYHDLPQQIRIALDYGQHLHELGYRGWADEDLFEFIGDDGRVHASRSESNVRRDAMTHLTGLLVSHPELAQSFLRGELSVCQDDHFPLNDRFGALALQPAELAKAIADEGLPLFSWDNPEGVILMSVPLWQPKGESGYFGMSYAVVATSDGDRQRWVNLMKQRVGRHSFQ